MEEDPGVPMLLRNFKLFHKGLVLVSVPLLFEIAFICLLTALLQQAEAEIDSETRAKNIIGTVDTIRKDWSEVGLNYKMAKQGRPRFARRLENALESIETNTQKLEQFAAGHPLEQRLTNQLVERTSDQLAALKRALADPDDQRGFLFVMPESNETGDETYSSHPLNQIRSCADELLALENPLASELAKARQHTRELIVQCLFGGVALSVLISLVLTLYLSRSITARLDRVLENTKRLAKQTNLLEPVGGSDEISLLDISLHESAARLSELETFKKDMLSMVSHELRTPLTSIMGVVKLLRAGRLGELSDKAQSRLEIAENNTTRLIRLVNDLLQINKMEAGNLDMSFADCSIDWVIEQSIESVREIALAANVELAASGEAGSAEADAERLMQVIINLIGNAIKYSPAGACVELVSSRLTDFLEIRVNDQGRGIPTDFKEKVFEKFQQVELADSRDKKGTGLGLAICKAIIEQHGGQIGVDSEPGKGSSFWFRIPLERPRTLLAPSTTQAIVKAH